MRPLRSHHADATPRVAAGLFVLVALACASQGAVPGGPVDRVPPALVAVTPDSAALNVRPREVTFRFNKVMSERPAGAQALSDLVVVSPSDGPLNVDWRRQVIAIRPRKAWRENTTYSITLLPGMSDLRNNAIKSTVHLEFSTGGAIARGAVRGVAFDWVAQTIVRGARVEATAPTDTVLRWLATADSAGRFQLTNLPPGTWRVRVFRDDNRSGTLDARGEVFDSATLAVTDSARRDFYLFVHDTLPPRPTNVTAPDSVTVRVVFDKSLSPAVFMDLSRFIVTRADSSRVPLLRALPAAEFDSLSGERKRAQQDSILRADTSAAARRARARADSLRATQVADSLSRAQEALLRAARDTVKRDSLPKPARKAPVSAYVLELAAPLVSQQQMRLEVRGATNLNGRSGNTSNTFFWRRPAPPRDTAAVKPPAKAP